MPRSRVWEVQRDWAHFRAVHQWQKVQSLWRLKPSLQRLPKIVCQQIEGQQNGRPAAWPRNGEGDGEGGGPWGFGGQFLPSPAGGPGSGGRSVGGGEGGGVSGSRQKRTNRGQEPPSTAQGETGEGRTRGG